MSTNIAIAIVQHNNNNSKKIEQIKFPVTATDYRIMVIYIQNGILFCDYKLCLRKTTIQKIMKYDYKKISLK